MTPPIRTLLLLAVVVAGAALAGYCRGRASGDRDQWEAARDSALGVERAAWQRQLEDLYAAAHEGLRVADSALEAARGERRVAERLRVARDTIRLPDLVPADCAPWAESLSLCAQEAQALRRSIAADAEAFAALQNVAQANGNRALLAEDRVGRLEGLLENAPGEHGLPKWVTAVAGCALGIAAGRWAADLDGTDLVTACTAGGLGVTLALPTR